MKLLVRGLMILAGLTAVLLILLLALVLTLDPNRLKPLLQQEAAKRGAELRIAGDLRWRLFPNIGLSLGALSLFSLQDKTLLAEVSEAEVAVQLMSILQRQIRVDGVRLDGLEVRYEVDAQGKSAWQGIGSEDTTPASSAEPKVAGQTPPELSVERVDITNLALHYSNAQSGDRAEIRDLNLRASKVTLAGEDFPIELDLSAQWNDMAPVQLAWQGSAAVSLDTQIVIVDSAYIDLRAGDAKLRFKLSAETHWGEPLTSKGSLELEPAALPPLFKALGMTPIETANPRALQQVGGTATYELGPDQLLLNPVAVTLDKTSIKGQLQLKNFQQPVIATAWQGSAMVVDDYLSPSTETAKSGAPAQEAPPQPLPFDTMRALNLDAHVAFDSLTYKDLAITQPQMKVTAKNGLLKLDAMTLQVADGNITGNGQLDARGPEAQLQMALNSQGVELGTLLQTFAELDKVSGKVNADAVVTSYGATDKALKDNLVVEATAESAELRLVPINIEEQFCRALSILQQQTLPDNLEWPDMTRLEPVQMQLRYAANTLDVQQLSAQIAHLLSAASGTLNIDTGKFNFPLSLSLGDFASTVEGCLPLDEKWRKRALPIRCKGSLDDIGVGTCLPDTQLLSDMAKDRLKGEAKEKLEAERDRLEEKLGNKARELLEEKYGEEKGKNTEDAIRDLFNQYKKKKPVEPATEPPTAPIETPAATTPEENKTE
jgi:AsmA protein